MRLCDRPDLASGRTILRKETKMTLLDPAALNVEPAVSRAAKSEKLYRLISKADK